MGKLIELKDVKTSFFTHLGEVQAVRGVSYSLNKGEALGIVGESGSGKSVSSMAVMDLLPKPPARIASKSSIRILGKEIIGLSKKEMNYVRGNTVSMIFQDPMTCLNPYRRIDAQMIEGLVFHKGISKKEAIKKCADMLEYVHIPDPLKRISAYPHELSGGMRQRVMIAMALTCDPKLIFADEPTTALDVTVQAQIMKLFGSIQNNFDTSIVMISHDLGVIATQSDYILVMYAGQMMEFGTPEDVLERTSHPYTIALKRSIPKLNPEVGKKQELKAIKGNPPNLMKLAVGCPFAPRCEHATDQCLGRDIPIKKVGEGHFVRCIL